MTGFVCWLDKWQTLISGLLAIGAALLGAFLLQRQIRQAELHERNRVRRRLNAVRLTLPLTLSGLGDFARNAVGQLVQARNSIPSFYDGTSLRTFQPPAAPSKLVAELKEMVEATDDAAVISLIGEIISEIQVLSSRMQSLLDPVEIARMGVLGRNIDQYLIQGARLLALIEGLFDFARREADTGPTEISWDRVHSFFSQIHVDKVSYPELFRALDERKKGLPSVWQLRSVETED